MDEHDDDLPSEVIEGEEIETDSFDVDQELEIPDVEDPEDGVATTGEDESEL